MIKFTVVIVAILTLGLCSCRTTNTTTTSVITPYGTKIVASYGIGAFHPKVKGLGPRRYNRMKMTAFLNTVDKQFRTWDIISVDGLKFRKEPLPFEKSTKITTWTPYPNPPMPVLEPGEDRWKHLKEYAQWIEDHPHFGLPPLPPIFD